MTKLPPDFETRVYSGWLGKCIGVRFGAPLENWTYQDIRAHLGELDGYLPIPAGKIFKPDDDTALPMILVQALRDYGSDLTAKQIGETWLNYLGDQHGTLWWGGYGISAEHTAYLNLQKGIPAPQSGSMELNGATLAEQIGGQIFSDIWGLVIPTDPHRAAEYAAKAASVSHDGSGIHGGMFIAALVSAAFGESAPDKLIELALETIPSESEFACMARAVVHFYHEHPEDWHAAYHYISENYGDFPGIVHIIPNAAVIVMALLYGNGDFSRSIQIANMAGWDTDCNVGNVGAIMGVAVGIEGIDNRWREPINDLWVGASIIGTRNLSDAASQSSLIARFGLKLAGEQVPSSKARYPFSLPGATHGFQSRSHLGTVVALRQVETPSLAKKDAKGTKASSALRVTIRKLKKKGEARIFVPTYLRPEQLSSNYYGASFSPKICPGQVLRVRLFLPDDAPNLLHAGLYVWDDNRDVGYQDPGKALVPGQWHELEYRIPPLHGACLNEAGVVFRNMGEPWSGSALLADFDWSGTPDFSFDFVRERHEYDAISQWTYLRGYWRLEGGGYHGSGNEISETYSGDIEWTDYVLHARLTPLSGGHHFVLARVGGGLRSYALGLTPNGLTLYKNARGYQLMASASLDWQHNQSYELSLSVKGNTLTGWLDGGPRLDWTDDKPYKHGQIGLSNFSGCHTCYEHIAIRPIDT